MRDRLPRLALSRQGWAGRRRSSSTRGIPTRCTPRQGPPTVPRRSIRADTSSTTDGGAHWRSTATTGAGWTRADALAADPHRPGTLYAGNVVAVWKTVDSGRSWQAFNKGLFPAKPRICNRDGATRPPLCRKFPFGTPGTTSWNRGEGWVTALAVDPANSRIVYSGADAVRKSTDGGHTWKAVSLPDHGVYVNISTLAIAPTRPRGDLRDRGQLQRTHLDLQVNRCRQDLARGGTPRFGIRQPGRWSFALAVDSQQPTTLYAVIRGALFTSTDAGDNWQPTTGGLPQGVSSLAVDPQHPGIVYAGLYTVRKDRRQIQGGLQHEWHLRDEKRGRHLESSRLGRRDRHACGRSCAPHNDLRRGLDGRLRELSNPPKHRRWPLLGPRGLGLIRPGAHIESPVSRDIPAHWGIAETPALMSPAYAKHAAEVASAHLGSSRTISVPGGDVDERALIRAGLDVDGRKAGALE